MSAELAIKPRFSGHETFACRFAWLPKAVRLIERDPAALTDDEAAMLELGLGKNMVKSLRFWLDAFDVAEIDDGQWRLTGFGAAMFGEGGMDPFIERAETQWILHWKLATAVEQPLFVWRHVFYGRMRPDFTREELLIEMRAEGTRLGHQHSNVTLLQHADIFLHTYLGSLKPKAPEDALDGPLVDLGLLERTRRRGLEGNAIEPSFILAQTPLRRIGSAVVDYSIVDYWKRRRGGEKVITFRDLAHGEGSPGATFRIPSEELRDHVERSQALWSYRPSGDSGLITMRSEADPTRLLEEIYE